MNQLLAATVPDPAFARAVVEASAAAVPAAAGAKGSGAASHALFDDGDEEDEEPAPVGGGAAARQLLSPLHLDLPRTGSGALLLLLPPPAALPLWPLVHQSGALFARGTSSGITTDAAPPLLLSAAGCGGIGSTVAQLHCDGYACVDVAEAAAAAAAAAAPPDADPSPLLAALEYAHFSTEGLCSFALCLLAHVQRGQEEEDGGEGRPGEAGRHHWPRSYSGEAAEGRARPVRPNRPLCLSRSTRPSLAP